MRDRTSGARWLPAALWLGFGAIAAVSATLVLHRPAVDRLSDLHIYHGAIRHAQAGRPLYEFVADNGGPFTYPPFAALVLWPIGAVPEPVLPIVWLAFTVAAIAAIAVAAGGVLRRAGRGPWVLGAVACALMVSAPAQSNLRFGQVSVFIVLLALVDGAGLTPARYRGVLVGVAAAVKLTPLLFVVYFVAARRYRDAARAAAAFVACAAVAAVLLPGDSWTYWTGTVLNTSRIGNLASLGNQSLHGMLLRVGVSDAVLPVLWAALVLAICAVALYRARQLDLAGRPAHAAILVGCATVTASPVSWTHHQVWPVLAAMLLVGAVGALRRVAGVALLVSMVASLGVLLSRFSMRPAIQFLLENARALGAIAVCLAGFGSLAAATARSGRRTAGPYAGHRWLRLATAAAVVVGFVAVQPLPAGADPTFKAYTIDDVHNPRYFFVCRDRVTCTAFAAGAPIRFGVTAEKTKVRVNGVVDASVARLEFQSAPGGPARPIPLVEAYPGQRLFSFRSANLSHGRLVAYRADGTPIAAYTDELSPPMS